MAVRRSWAPPARTDSWPAIADPFFSLAHDDRSGRPRLHERALPAGLSAALLMELVLARRIEIDPDQVRVISANPPTDAVATTILNDLLIAPEKSAADWLSTWEDTVYERVVGRLLSAGQIEMVTRRRFLVTYAGYQPVNRTAGSGVAVRLETLLLKGDPLSAEDAALCGLIAATGMSRKREMWRKQNRDLCRKRLDAVVQGLRPSLTVLVNETQTLLDQAVAAPS